jgi:hypothetical protein
MTLEDDPACSASWLCDWARHTNVLQDMHITACDVACRLIVVLLIHMTAGTLEGL